MDPARRRRGAKEPYKGLWWAALYPLGEAPQWRFVMAMIRLHVLLSTTKLWDTFVFQLTGSRSKERTWPGVTGVRKQREESTWGCLGHQGSSLTRCPLSHWWAGTAAEQPCVWVMGCARCSTPGAVLSAGLHSWMLFLWLPPRVHLQPPPALRNAAVLPARSGVRVRAGSVGRMRVLASPSQ